MRLPSKRLFSAILIHGLLGSFTEIQFFMYNAFHSPIKNFLNESFYHNYDIALDNNQYAILHAIVGAMVNVGTFVGALRFIAFMDTLGRKRTGHFSGIALTVMLPGATMAGVLGLVAAMLMIIARPLHSFELFTLAQFLVGIGFALQIVLRIYVAECAPDDCRGFTVMLLSSLHIFASLSTLAMALPNAFGNDEYWTFVPVICAVMSLLYLVAIIPLPDSPKFLYMMRSDRPGTISSICFYHHDNVDHVEVLEEYQREFELTSERHSPLSEILKSPSLRRPLILVVCCRLASTWSCSAFVSQYTIAILTEYGLHPTKALLVQMLCSATLSPVNFAAPFVVEKCGRRPLFLTCCALLLLESATLGTGQWLVDFWGPSNVTVVVGVAGVVLGLASRKLGTSSMVPLLISELCPPSTRAAIGSIAIILPIFAVIPLSALFAPSMNYIGAFFYVPLMITQMLIVQYVVRHLPETRNLPVDVAVQHLVDDAEVDVERRRILTRSRCGTAESNRSYHEIY